jgi:hypothetical protein
MVEHTVIDININPLQDMKNFPINDNDKIDTISILSYTDLCSICYSKMENESKTFSCSHTYHKNCINEWLNNNTTCPICRKKIINEVKQPLKNNQVSPITNQQERRVRPITNQRARRALRGQQVQQVQQGQRGQRVQRVQQVQQEQRNCINFMKCITTNIYYVSIILLYLCITIYNIVSINIAENYINKYNEQHSLNKINGSSLIIMINIFYFSLLMVAINKSSTRTYIVVIECLLYIFIIVIYTDYIKKIVNAYKEIGTKMDNYVIVSFILYIIIMVYLYINIIIIKCVNL